MSQRSDVPPDTLHVDLDAEGVGVEYTDGRTVFYHGVPEKREGSVTTPPGKEVHVLVTDASGSSGVLVYVNDRRTHDDVLEDSGVGRVILEDGEEASVFPGVTARVTGYRVAVAVEDAALEGRVFVFAEDEMQEFAYEIV